MDIDYSFMSLTSTLKTPVDSTSEKKEGAVFGGTVTQLTTLERNDLRIKGFRNVEISEAIKRLQERSVSISYDALLQDLQQTGKSLKEDLYAKVASLLDQSAGILSKVELLHALMYRARSHHEPILHRAMDDHYATLWPRIKCIASLVGKWPQRYRQEAAVILGMWPVLTINGDVKVDFSSATDHFCQNNHWASSDPEVLSYPTFFKLIKDIWFHAMESGDTGCLNRVTHLLIVFTQLISYDNYEFNGGSREERHESVVRNQFKNGLKAVKDISALAFFLVTHAPLWNLKKEIVLQELINRALESEVEHLAGFYCEWLEGSAAQTNSEEELTQAGKQIARKIQSQKVITVIKETYFLEAIAEYMIKYSDKFFFPAQARAISHGSYCDKSTFQLLHPVLPPDHVYDEVIERIARGLNKIFTAPDYQHLFVGTPEYHSLQNRKKWKQVIDKVRKKNWDEKSAAARITIDATLQKVRAVRVVEQRLSRMVNQVGRVVADREDKRRALVKQHFHQAGFVPQIDPDDQSVFYPASYYLLRKQALFALKQCKHAAESVIGTTIPFCATYSQISQTLRCFRQLPIEESRYWQMSGEYARNTLIPELVQDFSLNEQAITHQARQDKQKKFITCKCLSCTICDVDVYLCRCATGIGRKLSEKLSRYKSKALYANVEKNVKKYIESTFCTADFDWHVPSEKLNQILSAELLKDNTVSIGQLNDIKRKCSEGHEDDASDVDDDGEAASDSEEWGYDNSLASRSSAGSSLDDFRLNAHLTSNGTLCPKQHVLKPSAMATQVTRNIVRRIKDRMIKKSDDGATAWKAEATGASAARHFYQTVGVPESIVNSNNVAKWFANHPSCKKKAVELLGKYSKINHLIDKETLEFRPRSFKKISCDVVYHDLDQFQKHLGKVRFHVKSPGLPLKKSDHGRYLHRTFCMCCRVNFGQHKELKEHLKIHQEKMEAAFAQIEKKNLAGRDDSMLLLPDSENNALADLQLRLHQQGQDVQLQELFKDLAV